VVRADLSKASLAPQLAVGDGDGFGLEPVGSIARRSRALAAINGSFFSPKGGEPIGLLVLDGQIISSSYINRSVFGIRHDGTCFIDNARLLAAVRLEREDKVFIANGVNQNATRDQIVLYTPHYGRRTRTVPDPSRREFAISSDGTVLAAATGNMEIPRNGYVLSGQGKAIWNLKKFIRIGDRAMVYSELNGLWRGVKYAIGGGPTLVERGNVNVTAKQERFGPQIASGRAPRTAIGYLGAKEVVLVTVDGRQSHSVGMTLYELARYMREIGAMDAINLDGGGSTTLVVGGRTMNRPSGGHERPVNNALLLSAGRR
jgi:exopolysaccharide biosynthesis protein